MLAIKENSPVINEAESVEDTTAENYDEMRLLLEGELNQVRSIRDVASFMTITGGTGVLYTATSLIDSHISQIVSSEMDIWAKAASIAAFAIGTIGVLRSNSRANNLRDTISGLSLQISNAEVMTTENTEQIQEPIYDNSFSDMETSPAMYE